MTRSRSRRIALAAAIAFGAAGVLSCEAVLDLQSSYELAADGTAPGTDGSQIDGNVLTNDASTDADSGPPEFSEAGVDAGSIAAPRLISPLTTATVSMQTPKISWELPSGVEGAHVEICADRACTTIQTTFDAPGTSGAPTAALKPGLHFVRLAGRVGPTVGIALSATWEFFVPHRSAPRQTSYAGFPDFNGDGHPDVIAAGGGTTKVNIFNGGSTGPADAPFEISDNNAGGADNFSRATFGDIDGDGFSDLVVGHLTTIAYPGDNGNRVYVYQGTPAGFSSASLPKWTITVPLAPADAGVDSGTTISIFADSVAVPGDVNSDGYADIFVSGVDTSTGGGVVFGFFGHENGPSLKPDVELTGVSTGVIIGGNIGDVNGDGYDDLLFGTQLNYAAVFLGGPNGPSTLTGHPLVQPASAASGIFATPMSGAGDLDGDGYPDIVVGAQIAPRSDAGFGPAGPGEVYVYRGETGAGLFTSDLTISGPGMPGDKFGAASAIIGDVDGDGYDDLEVAAQTNSTGAAYFYAGGMNFVSTATLKTVLVGSAMAEYFGTAAQVGDLDGDGFCDVAVSEFEFGVIDLYYGGAGGITMLSTTGKLHTLDIGQMYILAKSPFFSPAEGSSAPQKGSGG